MKHVLSLLGLCITLFCQAQSLEQMVVGSSGNFSSTSNGTTLSSTVGEVMTTTISSNSATLTQGFQQPVIVNLLSSENVAEEYGITVFPNPTTALINVQKTIATPLKAQLYDAAGKLINTYTLTQPNNTIDLQKLASGTYLLSIIGQTPTSAFQIQKIH